LVDGSTRIPKIQHLLKDFSNGKEARGINPGLTFVFFYCLGKIGVEYTQPQGCWTFLKLGWRSGFLLSPNQ